MLLINGKRYPMWELFVGRKAEWVGGLLSDRDDDPLFGVAQAATEIKDIELRPNGADSAFFSIVGQDFECGFDVRYGGIDCGSPFESGVIRFRGYGGHTFTIQKPAAASEERP